MTLETAKALKEAGWGQFHCRFYHDTKLRKIAWSGDIQLAPVDFGDRYIANPSLEELLAVMPTNLNGLQYAFHLVIQPQSTIKQYSAYYNKCFGNGEQFKGMTEHSDPTEAVAQLWLKLKQENLI